MAEDGDTGEKTEAPSGRRVSQFRNEGMTGASLELSQVIGMIAAFVALKSVVPWIWTDMETLFKIALTIDVQRNAFTASTFHHSFINVLLLLGPKVLFILVVAGVVGGLAHAIQTKFLWSWQLLTPKAKFLNPVNGLRRIFSLQNLFNTAKQIAKLALLGPIAYFAFFESLPLFMMASQLSVNGILGIIGETGGAIFLQVTKVVLTIAVIDMAYKKWKHIKDLKMSKQEAKDERKSTDGDETIRRKIIQIGMMRARERMMKAVPTADVIVTNPTHISVALKYDGTPGVAPIVVAKGQGHVALRIRQVATRHGIPIMERKPLARALFKAVEIGGEIPYDLFKAVAEILAYVYRLKGKNPITKRKQK
jgi:flagellar biosynthetic protein FlhB